MSIINALEMEEKCKLSRQGSGKATESNPNKIN
jgi:hypothetical protein